MKSKIIGIVILLALVVTAGVLLLSSNGSLEEKGAALVSNANQDTQDRVEVFEFEANQTTTAFALLEQSGLDFTFKEYDMGVFIESINGLKNGADNKYWLYYVNGEMPMVAADKQPVVAGDKIEFKFEKSSF